MKGISIPQIQKIHVLLRQHGISDEQKREMIRELTAGRTNSSKDLTTYEAITFIQYLEGDGTLERMRNKVFALAYHAGIIYGDSPADKKMNAAKLNAFLLERGTVRKKLGSMSKAELIKTVNQFEAIARNSENSKAGKIVKNLLNELKISIK